MSVIDETTIEEVVTHKILGSLTFRDSNNDKMNFRFSDREVWISTNRDALYLDLEDAETLYEKLGIWLKQQRGE